MSTRYIVEGNLAVRETVTRSEAVPLDKMLENLTAYQPLDILPTPHNLRSISVKPRPNMELAATIIVGHDPMKRRITHKNCHASSHSAAPKSYLLQFPYGIFWFALNGNKMSGATGDSIIWNPQGWGYVWMKEPYTNNDQFGWTPNMPNIFGDSRICFGANSVDGGLPLGHFVDQSVNTFWTSEFNQDLSDNYFPYPSMKAWSEAPDDDWPNWSIWHDSYSKQTLKNKFERFEGDMHWNEPVPSNTGATIPALPTYPTFDNLNVWVEGLNDQQRARLLAVAGAAE